MAKLTELEKLAELAERSRKLQAAYYPESSIFHLAEEMQDRAQAYLGDNFAQPTMYLADIASFSDALRKNHALITNEELLEAAAQVRKMMREIPCKSSDQKPPIDIMPVIDEIDSSVADSSNLDSLTSKVNNFIENMDVHSLESTASTLTIYTATFASQYNQFSVYVGLFLMIIAAYVYDKQNKSN